MTLTVTRSVSALSIALGIALLPAAAGAQNEAQQQAKHSAMANIEPLAGSNVTGTVTLEQMGNFVGVRATINGLEPGKHGFHVHEGNSCAQRGSHFNPEKAPHGGPDQPASLRHVGDLGNLVADQSGTAQYARIDHLLSLSGPSSIDGRVIIVHSGEDDYTSQPAGNAGDPVACGVLRSGAQ